MAAAAWGGRGLAANALAIVADQSVACLRPIQCGRQQGIDGAEPALATEPMSVLWTRAA